MKTLRLSLTLLLIVLAQGLVVKNVSLGAVLSIPVQVFLMPIFFVLIRIVYPPQLILLFGFIGGLVIDLFYQTPGLHAGAAVCTAYARRYILLWLEPRTGYPSEGRPIDLDNRRWYITTLALLTLVYAVCHAALLLFSIVAFLELLARTILSGTASLLCLAMISLLIKALRS